jgi:hypothetical protein
MMKRITSIGAMFLAFCTFAKGGQTLPLNTGYNHSVPGPYDTVMTYVSATRDNYWTYMSPFPTINPAIGPSWVIKLPVKDGKNEWWAAMAGSSWINARNTEAGGGSSPDNNGYVLFKKGFCLLPGFNPASLTFQIRADNRAFLYLNSVLCPLGSVSENFLSAIPFSGGTTDQTYFKVGINWFYVLVEDSGGGMGFDLVGEIKANGLLPTVASWDGKAQNAVFAPCPCNTPPPTLPGGPKNATVRAQAGEDDQKVINDIIKIAEAHRAAKGKK